jgi:hypothetical protein
VGHTHVRRTSLIAIVALVWIAAGCGDERPGAVADGGASVVPASPSPSSSSSAPAPTGALTGFPLDLGYATHNEDDGSPVRVTTKPGVEAFDTCGVATWDPHRGTTDVLGVEFRGEAEWFRGRTLALYPSAEAAALAVASARDALAGCADETVEPGYGTTHTDLHIRLGDESVVWGDTYWQAVDGEKLHDTGLTVYHLVRVGRAVLLAYEYGEGNGTEQSRRNAIERATELERPVVTTMNQVA